MPVRLFTDAERERLNRFPPDISPADVLAFFTLSDDELELIGDRNRLGFGLQLKTLPYLGFVPDALGGVPARVVSYLALQLSVPADALEQYGDREHTRTDHLRESRNGSGSVTPVSVSLPRSVPGCSTAPSNTTGRSCCCRATISTGTAGDR